MSTEPNTIGVYYHPDDFPKHLVYNRTWIEGFISSLKVMLTQEGVTSLQIEEYPLKLTTKKCRLMLVVFSEKIYNTQIEGNSDSNQLNGWLESIKQNCPVLLIMPRHLSGYEMPKELKSSAVYRFFSLDPYTNLYESFEYIGGQSDDRYWLALDELASDIKRLLSQPYTVQRPPVQVYLGNASASLSVYRTKLLRLLKNLGCRVFPESDWGSPMLEEELAQVLKGCALAIHFMGESYGTGDGSNGKSVMAMEYEQALMLENLQQMVWIPKGQEVYDPKQQAYLEYVRNHQPDKKHYLRLETGFSPFQNKLSTIIEDLITDFGSAEKNEEKPCIVAIRAKIGVDWHPVRRLAKEKGWDFELFEQQEAWERVYELLERAVAIILVDEGGNKFWVEHWKRLFRKALGYTPPHHKLQRLWIGQNPQLSDVKHLNSLEEASELLQGVEGGRTQA